MKDNMILSTIIDVRKFCIYVENHYYENISLHRLLVRKFQCFTSSFGCFGNAFFILGSILILVVLINQFCLSPQDVKENYIIILSCGNVISQFCTNEIDEYDDGSISFIVNDGDVVYLTGWNSTKGDFKNIGDRITLRNNYIIREQM